MNESMDEDPKKSLLLGLLLLLLLLLLAFTVSKKLPSNGLVRKAACFIM